MTQGRVRGRKARLWRAVLVLASTLLVIPLSACDFQRNQQGPVAVRVDGDDLLVAICRDVNAVSVDVSAASSQFSDWLKIWAASGAASLEAGSVFTGQTLRNEFQNAHVAALPERVASVEVVIVSSDGDARNIVASIAADPADFVGGNWVRPDGSVNATPCSEAP